MKNSIKKHLANANLYLVGAAAFLLLFAARTADLLMSTSASRVAAVAGFLLISVFGVLSFCAGRKAAVSVNGQRDRDD